MPPCPPCLGCPPCLPACPPAWAAPPACPAPPACLQATFKNQNDLAFQDCVGCLLLESAQAIPQGLLVFMPSYAMLDRLMARWKVRAGRGEGGGGIGLRWGLYFSYCKLMQSFVSMLVLAACTLPCELPGNELPPPVCHPLLCTPPLQASGLLKRLGELKRVVQEPRGGGQDALKKTMAEYYAAIQGGGGAVFFAVCRGKVRRQGRAVSVCGAAPRPGHQAAAALVCRQLQSALLEIQRTADCHHSHCHALPCPAPPRPAPPTAGVRGAGFR
jgi:hypothetical protein